MKKQKRYNKTQGKQKQAKEPIVLYEKKSITFSTLETQHDIQLLYAMSISPIERLKLMRKINAYAFKNKQSETILKPPVKLIFSSYEYISR